MPIKYVDIEYLRAQNANAGQLILAGQSNTLTYSQYVTVNTSGNVGIGTATPTSPLTVSGNIQLLTSGTGVIFPDNSILTSATQYASVGSPGTIQFAGANNTFDGNQTSLFWDNGNVRLGIGTSVPVSTVQFKHTALESTSTFWSTTDPTVLDSFTATKVRSAHYFVQITDEDNSKFHTSQIMVVQDGVTAYKSEYNIVTSQEKLGEFDAVISGGNLELIFTAFDATNKTVKITRTSMTA